MDSNSCTISISIEFIVTIVVNVNNRNTSMVLGDKEQVLYGPGFIVDELCGKKFRISSKSFYQINPIQTEKLYDLAIKAAKLTGKETVIDAYCGIGTIGIAASAGAKEGIGVELNKEAVRDAGTNAKISLKTRIGIDDPEDFYELLDIYNKYPLEELIIHPRVLKEYYKGKPHWEIFDYAVKNSKNALCYNGDIFSVADYEHLQQEVFQKKDGYHVHAIMLGRGILQNPALIEQLAQYEHKGEKKFDFDKNQFKLFHDRLRNDYMTQMSGDMNVLFKMKELWFYMIMLFPGQEKVLKKIKKAKKLAEYDAAIKELM